MIQYVDSSSFGWRKKAIVAGYHSFDVMNEREFRQMLCESKAAEGLSHKQLNDNIKVLIKTLNKNYKKSKKKKQNGDNNNHNIRLSQSQSQSQTIEETNENGQIEDEDDDDDDDTENDMDDDHDFQMNNNMDNEDGSNNNNMHNDRGPIMTYLDAENNKDMYDGNISQQYEFEMKENMKDSIKKNISNYAWKVPEDVGVDLEKEYKQRDKRSHEVKWNKVVDDSDDGEIDDFGIDDGYFRYKIVHRRTDLWRKGNYHMYHWTKSDGTKYKVFMSGKTAPNIARVLNDYVREWKLLSQAWDAANAVQLKEYNIQKDTHDARNKDKLVRKYEWKPKLSQQFDSFWSVNWTTDFGMY